ncbi:MAG: hypothetical protein IPH77_06255 [Ignavibacteria bacterium]|nr:hypothetical protein [Ignavibacteria bacterium]
MLQKIEDAGADAIELNIYYIPTDFQINGLRVEDMCIEGCKTIKSAVKILLP